MPHGLPVGLYSSEGSHKAALGLFGVFRPQGGFGVISNLDRVVFARNLNNQPSAFDAIFND
nr:hypothetical protein [Roseovarius sp. BRH_c41]